MRGLRFIGLSTVTVLSALLLVTACGDDDDTDTDPNPTATEESTLDTAPEYRMTAEEACPEEALQSCVDQWVSTATSPLTNVLCVNEESGTFFVEAGGTAFEGISIGDACETDPSHTVVAVHSP